MEVQRCRFLDYRPGEIMHLACFDSLCLVLFEDSSISLYKSETWSLLLQYPPTQSLDLRRAVWLDSTTFVTSGLGGMLFIYSPNSIEPKHSTLIPGNGVWDMARLESSVALACDDGILRLFSTFEDEFYLATCFPKQPARLLSVYASRGFVFVGTDAGAVVKFSEQGQVVQRMQTDSPVWVLSFAQDYLVSGEGSGVLSFWQHSRGVLKQGIKTHEGDILTICVVGEEVYASGVDSKVVRSRYVGNEWVITGRAKGQSHDVRSLAWASGHLVSGGVTSDICVYTEEIFVSAGVQVANHKGVATGFRKTQLRHIPTLPFKPVCAMATNLVLEGKPHALDLWSVDSTVKSITKVLTVNCKGNSGVVCFAIKDDGKVFAFSTALALKVVKVDLDDMQAEMVKEKFRPCYVMEFVEDGIRCAFNEFFVVNLKNFDVKVLYRFDSMAVKMAVDKDLTAILLRDNKIHIFKKNSLCFSLPSVSRSVTALGIAHNSVFFATDDNHFQGFNCKTFNLEGFSSKFSSSIPKNYINDVNRIIGILPYEKQKIILYTHYSFTVVDLHKKPPKKCEILTKDKFPEHKHTWAGILSHHSLHSENSRNFDENLDELGNFVINKRFGPILAFKKTAETLWVAELDWEKALEVKPKPLNLHKYGK